MVPSYIVIIPDKEIMQLASSLGANGAYNSR